MKLDSDLGILISPYGAVKLHIQEQLIVFCFGILEREMRLKTTALRGDFETVGVTTSSAH